MQKYIKHQNPCCAFAYISRVLIIISELPFHCRHQELLLPWGHSSALEKPQARKLPWFNVQTLVHIIQLLRLTPAGADNFTEQFQQNLYSLCWVALLEEPIICSIARLFFIFIFFSQLSFQRAAVPSSTSFRSDTFFRLMSPVQDNKQLINPLLSISQFTHPMRNLLSLQTQN